MLKTILNKFTGNSSNASSVLFQERKDAILSGFISTLNSLKTLRSEQEQHITSLRLQISSLEEESMLTENVLNSTDKTISKIQSILD